MIPLYKKKKKILIIVQNYSVPINLKFSERQSTQVNWFHDFYTRGFSRNFMKKHI